jgi:hypothetical protein
LIVFLWKSTHFFKLSFLRAGMSEPLNASIFLPFHSSMNFRTKYPQSYLEKKNVSKLNVLSCRKK